MEQSEVNSAEQKQAEMLENFSKQLIEIKSSLKTINLGITLIMIVSGMILGFAISNLILK